MKPGTGLRDAPKCFNMQLKKITQSYGLVSSIIDSELLILFEPRSKKIVMLIAVHVDDLKITADSVDRIHDFIKTLEQKFGEFEVKFNTFVCCGVQHEPDGQGGYYMHQTEFIQKIKPMHLTECIGAPSEKELSDSGKKHFLSLLMTIAYALMTRIDIAVYITALQRVAQKATVLHVKRLNTVVKYAQQNPRKLRFRCMPQPDVLLLISDASFKKEDSSGHALRGFVALRACSKDLCSGQKAPVHLLDYGSKQQRHVVRATFSAELYACTDTLDIGILQAVALDELLCGMSISVTDAKSAIERGPTHIKIYIVVDAMSVFTATTAPSLKVPAESSTFLHLKWIRELLDRHIFAAIAWCDTRCMVADGLTKGSVDREVLHDCMSGSWNIVDLKLWRTSRPRL